jgi:acetyl esterase/lipase
MNSTRDRVDDRCFDGNRKSWFKAENRSFMVVVFCFLVGLIPAFAALGQEYLETDDIVYRQLDGRSLMMDIESPLPQGPARPAVVFLCGNSWGFAKTMNRGEFSYALDVAVAKGYVGVSVDYSSSIENNNGRAIGTFPAQVYDVKSAIRFLKANAAKYGIDPSRIGIVGHSSGGNLALMLALTVPSDGLEGDDGHSEYSSSVQAVVSLAGPPDMFIEYHQDPDGAAAYMGGTPSERPDLYRKASPVTYVRKGGAPILTIQGDQDLIIEGVMPFDAKMKAADGTHTLVIKKGAGHMDFDIGEQIVWDFLNGELKK